jgi:hypothetical protein
MQKVVGSSPISRSIKSPVTRGFSFAARPRRLGSVTATPECRLRCYLGSHRWVSVSNKGEQYLECGRCGRYGGVPASFSWGRRNPNL